MKSTNYSELAKKSLAVVRLARDATVERPLTIKCDPYNINSIGRLNCLLDLPSEHDARPQWSQYLRYDWEFGGMNVLLYLLPEILALWSDELSYDYSRRVDRDRMLLPAIVGILKRPSLWRRCPKLLKSAAREFAVAAVLASSAKFPEVMSGPLSRLQRDEVTRALSWHINFVQTSLWSGQDVATGSIPLSSTKCGSASISLLTLLLMHVSYCSNKSIPQITGLSAEVFFSADQSLLYIPLNVPNEPFRRAKIATRVCRQLTLANVRQMIEAEGAHARRASTYRENLLEILKWLDTMSKKWLNLMCWYKDHMSQGQSV